MLKSRCEDEYLMRLKGRDASILMKFESWCEFDDEIYEFHIVWNELFIEDIAKVSPAAHLFQLSFCSWKGDGLKYDL